MKKFLKILLGLLVLLALMVAGGYAYVQSAGGKIALARWAGKLASNADMTLTIEGITGQVPADMRIDHITLADKDGVWLELRGLHIAWSPSSLLHKPLRIQALEAENIDILRLPVSPAKAKKEQKFALPTIPDITLNTLSIGHLAFEAGIAPQREVLILNGAGNRSGYTLHTRTLEGVPTTLDAQVALADDHIGGTLQFSETAGGVLSHLLKLPEGAAIHADVEAQTNAEGMVQLQQADIQAGRITLHGSGEVALANQAVNATLAASIPDAADLSALAGTPLSGALQLHLTANGPPDAVKLALNITSASLTAGTTAVAQLQAEAQGVLNTQKQTMDGSLLARADINAMPVAIQVTGNSTNKQLIISALSASYGAYQLTGKADADLDSQHFHADLATAALPLEQLFPSAHFPGNLAATLQAQGNFSHVNMQAQADITSPEGNSTLHAHADVDAAAKSMNGVLDGSFERDSHHFFLTLPVEANPEQVKLAELSLKGDGLSLSGHAVWQVAASLLDAQLALDAGDLRPLGQLIGKPLSGQMRAQLAVSPEAGHQRAMANATLNAVQLSGLTVGNASLTASAGDVKALTDINATVSASNMEAGTTHLETLALKVAGSLTSALSGTLEVNGSSNGKLLSVALGAHGERDKRDVEVTHLTLQRLSGVYDGKPINLKVPAELRLKGEQATLSPLVIAVAGGNITLKGLISPPKLDAHADLSHILLQDIPGAQLPPGTVDAKLMLSGSMAAPKAKLSVNGALTAAEYPLRFAINSNWEKNRLTATTSINADKAALAANVAMPAAFSLSPVVFGISPATPLSGKTTLDAPLDALNPFLRASGQRLAGQLSGGGAIGGTLGAPLLNGRFALNGGQYDQIDSGVCLRGVNATFSGTRQGFAMDTLHAATDDGGTLDGHAALALSGARAVNGILRFSHFRLFCGGLATGNLDGSLQADGTLAAMKLAGALTVAPLNVQLPGAANPKTAIPQVKTVRQETMDKAKKAPPPGAGNDALTLNITINAPDRMFVRGRGLDAQFTGKLAITGPATNPVVQGQFQNQSQRGTFTLLDRQLKLTNAVLNFEGPIPPSPFLDVQATTTVKTTTITVSLSGPATKPTLAFTADPAQPQDEVLALLLFGGQLSTLSPFQAAQLAQSSAELSGFSSGPGVLGKVRSFLGVDTLNVGTDSNNDVSVGTGKYITDKIYVGATQGAKPNSSAVTTEVEVYPHVSADTSVSVDGQQSLGLQWKYDY